MDWTVLLIGGASGIGKSYIAKELAQDYKVKMIEVDDICQAVKAMTTRADLPAIHYWSTGVNWKDIGVSGNVKWLSDVSGELSQGLKAIVDSHIEEEVPVIIEGDFISPMFAATFNDPKVKSIFIYEDDESQIVQNYLRREGGEAQNFRASISVEYGKLLKSKCDQHDIGVIESRPWNTLRDRVIEEISR